MITFNSDYSKLFSFYLILLDIKFYLNLSFMVSIC